MSITVRFYLIELEVERNILNKDLQEGDNAFENAVGVETDICVHCGIYLDYNYRSLYIWRRQRKLSDVT